MSEGSFVKKLQANGYRRRTPVPGDMSFADREHARHPARRHREGSTFVQRLNLRPRNRRSTPKDLSGIPEHNQEIARHPERVHKLKAKDSTGRWAYYFVYVLPEKEPLFNAALAADGMLELDSFGTIIASCYGEAPTPEICAFLRSAYGFDVKPGSA